MQNSCSPTTRPHILLDLCLSLSSTSSTCHHLPSSPPVTLSSSLSPSFFYVSTESVNRPPRYMTENRFAPHVLRHETLDLTPSSDTLIRGSNCQRPALSSVHVHRLCRWSSSWPSCDHSHWLEYQHQPLLSFLLLTSPSSSLLLSSSSFFLILVPSSW